MSELNRPPFLGVAVGCGVLDFNTTEPGLYAEFATSREHGGLGEDDVEDGGKGRMPAAAATLIDHATSMALSPDMRAVGYPERLGLEIHGGGGAANLAGGSQYLIESNAEEPGGREDLERGIALVTLLGNHDEESALFRRYLHTMSPRLALEAVPAGADFRLRRTLNVNRGVGHNRVLLTEEGHPISNPVWEAFFARIEQTARGAGFLALSSIPPDQLEGAIRSAKAAGVDPAVNPSSAWFNNGHSDPEKMRRLREILYGSGLGVILVNEAEANALNGSPNTIENAIQNAKNMSRHAGVVLCSLGKAGARLIAYDGNVELKGGDPYEVAKCKMPPVPDENRECNIGAGDNMAGGVLVGLATGLSLQKSLELGTEAAGHVIMHRGGFGHVRTPREFGRKIMGLEAA